MTINNMTKTAIKDNMQFFSSVFYIPELYIGKLCPSEKNIRQKFEILHITIHPDPHTPIPATPPPPATTTTTTTTTNQMRDWLSCSLIG